MKKFSKFLLSLIVVTGLLLPMSAQAYTVEQDPIQFSYHPGYASNEIIVLHEAGNPSNVGADSLDREVSFMKRNWQNAYVSYFVGSGGRVKQLAPNGYYQYGAGATGNSKAYAQIELARTNNAETFKKDYASYINLTRDLAKQAGFTFDLDDGTPYGIKTHEWITNNWWGDHTDPYGYLAQWGISKTQLARDLQIGLSENGGNSTNQAPSTDPTTAGAHYSVMTYGNNAAHVDQWGTIGNTLKTRGWHIADYQYQYVFIIDRTTGKELARQKAPGSYRPDVNTAYGTYGYVGYDVSFDVKRFRGKSIIPMTRATNDATGNTAGGYQDFYETRWYHDIK